MYNVLVGIYIIYINIIIMQHVQLCITIVLGEFLKISLSLWNPSAMQCQRIVGLTIETVLAHFKVTLQIVKHSKRIGGFLPLVSKCTGRPLSLYRVQLFVNNIM